MKERPIIFNSEMVRAILEGRKTMTRRVIKPQLPPNYIYIGQYGEGAKKPYTLKHKWIGRNFVKDSMLNKPFDNYEWLLKCPYGQVCDRLWVRERFCNLNKPDFKPEYYYYADCKEAEDYDPSECKCKPSIHMPRWASRITLEITNIRVERLQEITEEDALKEGVAVDKGSTYHVAGHEGEWVHITARGCFETLWDSINGKKYPWSSNPWVWVIELKKITP